MRKTILLTGFGPFSGVENNPSQRVVEALAANTAGNFDLITAVLPVDYEQADLQIRRLIRAHRPDIVLSVGVAAKRDAVRLERVALNLDDADLPDNAGLVRKGVSILEAAPPAYFSGLPLADLEAHLTQAGVSVRISNHAGAYLCNHVFFTAAHESEQLQPHPQVGFVHIPMAAEYDPEAQTPLADLVTAVGECLSFLGG